ncbi:MAG: PEGA domain-containing protein [Deltaproteobacteria bacterium]|nr:PEGA domain-containing protein [Deltaproteobacteria bacterium]
MKRFITVNQLDGTEQQFTDADLPLTVGSGSDSHIRIPESDIIAAYIGDAQGHLFIQAAPHTATSLFHNDRLLTESVWLKSKDQLSSESSVVHYELSGDRIVFSVFTSSSKSAIPTLLPPEDPPPGRMADDESIEQIPVEITGATTISKGKKMAIGAICLSFLLLGCAVLFVLSARPLELEITPDPDAVSVSGFPPAIRIGTRYLGLPGNYFITIKKKGYVTFEQDVAVDKTLNNRFSVNLEKLPGILHLLVTPADGVAVYSGEELIGTTPPNKLKIAPGLHRLTLFKEWYQPFKTEITIEGKEEVQNIETTLQPDWSDITITSDPTGAEVIIDDATLGSTPLSHKLLSGNHAILLKKESFSDSLRTITVTAGSDETYNFNLQLLPGKLSLASTPTGAVVSIDEQYKGTTPVDLTLPSAVEHGIKLSSPGFTPLEYQLMLSPGEKKELRLDLEQERGIVYLTTTPVNAIITINGKRYSNAQGRLTLPTAPQKLLVSSPGYKSVSRTIMPKFGFSQQISIDLTPDSNIAAASSESIQQKIPLKTASGQKLLYVEPSPFTMGAPRREPGRRANERERLVIMKKPFYISEKLVTNREYRRFNSKHDSGEFGGHSLNGDTQPVVTITWNDAVGYLNWLSEQDNLQPFYLKKGETFIAVSPPTTGYRLPTEAEWAFSARQVGSPRTQRYPWSGGFPPRTVIANFADESARTILPMVINGYNDTYPVTSPVGSFPPNKGGFYDMSGNASEWCHDYYSAYTSTLTNIADPLGPSSGSHNVIRGSNWKDGSVTELRLSYRAYHKEARNNVGFRIARYP